MTKGKGTAGPVERGTCKRLLQHLADDGAREARTLDGSRASATEMLAAEYRPLHGRELEVLLSNEVIDTGERGAIHCRPVLKGSPALIPLVFARIDLSRELPDVQLRVALFDIDGDVENVVGWRFETPSRGDEGMHSYHHAQPITELLRGKSLSAGQWYNETTPAFLLDAYSPATLILSMFVSLYGITYMSDLLRLDFRNEIKSVTANMRSIQAYWESI
jgi:hypothetical protein